MCGKPIREITTGKGKIIPAEQVAQMTKDKYKACLCSACATLKQQALEKEKTA
jgi:hypothetical protein